MNVTAWWSRRPAIRWNARPEVLALLALVLAWGVLPAGAATPADEGFQQARKMFVRGDVVGAMPLLRKAADEGHAPAQALLAQILDQAEFDKEAVDYFRKAALQGNADGEYGLGTMYAGGEGVARDPQEALRWYRLAAGHGHDRAILVLALAHLRGDLGLTDRRRDDGQARQWIRMAAEKGDVQAMDGLAKSLRSGDFGFAVDPGQAAEWDARVKKLRAVAGSRPAK